MIDTVESCEVHRRIVTIKRIANSEIGSDEGSGWLPAMLLVEGIAQSAALLHRLSYGELAAGRRPLLGFLRVQLHGSARAGETLSFDVHSMKMTLDGGVFRGTAHGSAGALAEVELAVASRRAEPS
jgi:hypothetical protein